MEKNACKENLIVATGNDSMSAKVEFKVSNLIRSAAIISSHVHENKIY